MPKNIEKEDGGIIPNSILPNKLKERRKLGKEECEKYNNSTLFHGRQNAISDSKERNPKNIDYEEAEKLAKELDEKSGLSTPLMDILYKKILDVP